MNGSRYAFLGFLAVVCSASTAFAAEIDFTDDAFQAAQGRTSFSYTASDGVTLTLSTGSRATLSYNDPDGFGIRSGWTDLQPTEIDDNEILTITFSQSVLLSDVFVTDLFNEWGGLETGSYRLNGGSATTFSALTSQGWLSNGELTLEVDQWVTSLTLTTPPNCLSGSDFSIAGLSYTTGVVAPPAPPSSHSVPELGGSAAPMALSLLIGCALLVSNRRRMNV